AGRQSLNGSSARLGLASELQRSGGSADITSASEKGPNPATAVCIRNVTKIFGDEAKPIRALDEVTMDIRHNEFFTLLGPSGCGKTTLLRLIAGFDQPTSGEILLYGQAISDKAPYERP